MLIPLAVPAAAGAVDVLEPPSGAAAALDQQVRFSWTGDGGAYEVLFSQDRNDPAWTLTDHRSGRTLDTTLVTTPRELGLTPGTWYWRICSSTFQGPFQCELDDEVRELRVLAPPFLTPREARRVVRRAIRRRFHRRPRRIVCRRVDAQTIACRAYWRSRRGRLRARSVTVNEQPDGYYYRVFAE